MLTRARALGTSWFDESWTLGASIPMTETAGRRHIREVNAPSPIVRSPGRAPVHARSSSSVRSSGSASPDAIPRTATRPWSSCSVARIRARQVTASGKMPPNPPLWTAWSSVVTSTMQSTTPRRVVVSAGCPTRQFPESAMTTASQRSAARSASRKPRRCFEPDSSSPSMKKRTLHGGRPLCASTAARCAAMPALSSDVPRPKTRPSRSTGSNGEEDQRDAGPGGWTSWCA